MAFIKNIFKGVSLLVYRFQLRKYGNVGKGVFVSSKASVIGKEFIEIGDKTSILQFAFLHCGPWSRNRIVASKKKGVEYLKFGVNCSVQPYALINSCGGSIEFGDNCSVNPYCVIYGGGGLIIGNNVSIATGVTIVPQSHKVTKGLGRSFGTGTLLQPIVIEDNVWIGAKAVILGGVTIGKGAIIAAGAVVNSDVAQGAYVGGIPAKVLKYRED